MPVFREDRNQRFDADGNLIDEEVVQVDVTEPTNRDLLMQRAETAMQGNRDYLALASPNTQQAVAQVNALTRQVNALIRLTVGRLEGTE